MKVLALADMVGADLPEAIRPPGTLVLTGAVHPDRHAAIVEAFHLALGRPHRIDIEWEGEWSRPFLQARDTLVRTDRVAEVLVVVHVRAAPPVPPVDLAPLEVFPNRALCLPGGRVNEDTRTLDQLTAVIVRGATVAYRDAAERLQIEAHVDELRGLADLLDDPVSVQEFVNDWIEIQLEGLPLKRVREAAIQRRLTAEFALMEHRAWEVAISLATGGPNKVTRATRAGLAELRLRYLVQDGRLMRWARWLTVQEHLEQLQKDMTWLDGPSEPKDPDAELRDRLARVERALDNGRLDRARRELDRIDRRVSVDRMPAAEAVVYRLIASRASRESEDYASAERLLAPLLDVADALSAEDQALVLWEAALLALAVDDAQRAISLLERCVSAEVAAELPPTVRAVTMETLGETRLDSGEGARALDAFEAALTLRSSEPTQDLGEARKNVARAALASGELARLEAIGQQALDAGDRNEGDATTAVDVASIAVAAAAPSMLALAQRAVTVSDRVGVPASERINLFARAAITAFNAGVYALTAEWLREALRLLPVAGAPPGLAAYLGWMEKLASAMAASASWKRLSAIASHAARDRQIDDALRSDFLATWGLSALGSSHWRTAANALQRALKLQIIHPALAPQRQRLRHGLALAYEKLGKPDEAAAALRGDFG